MSPSSYRKLIFGCAIAGSSIWCGISFLVPGVRPVQAHAGTAELAAFDEVLAGLSAPTPAIPEAQSREQRILAAADWPQNPFFHPVSAYPAKKPENAEKEKGPSPGGEQPRFVLNAIISGAEPLAMINGLVVTIGDQLADGSVITAIGTYSVRLQRPQGPWILRLSE